jgi:hypothetical protein
MIEWLWDLRLGISPDSQYQQFLITIFVFFLISSRKVLRQHPTISDDEVFPNPSHFIFYKNLSIQLYGPKTAAVQQTPLNYNTDVFLWPKKETPKGCRRRWGKSLYNRDQISSQVHAVLRKTRGSARRLRRCGTEEHVFSGDKELPCTCRKWNLGYSAFSNIELRNCGIDKRSRLPPSATQ